MTGLETLALETVVKGLASLVVNTAWKGGSTLFGKAGEALNDQRKQLVLNISRQYIQNYADRHCAVKVLGMREAVSLDEIYTTVQVLNKSTAKSFESIEALEELHRNSSQRQFRFNEQQQKKVGINAADESQFLMVLGAPGAGKSTFLRKIGLEALKGKEWKFQVHTVQHGKRIFKTEQKKCVPVLFDLKRVAAETINIEALIAEEFRICGFPEPEEFTEAALRTGSLLILFDGLDEVPSQRLNGVIEAIRNFVDRHHKNRFIASCRIAAYKYHSDFHRFTDVVVAEFDDEQIQQFIHNWFRADVDRQAQTAEKCWNLLNQKENASAKELAQTPLLLTFLCLVYDRSQNLPDNRSTLYGKALDILLEEWAAEKRIERDPIYQGFHADLEKVLLAEIAYQGFENDQLFFSEQDLTAQIKAFLADTLDAPK
ncbi:MAG: NACHT domain-containing protein, partial [Leptolyngbyaceae bacterium]|nr:NACHT domain-containing protein [Leptolyngbyaceae bacterium]